MVNLIKTIKTKKKVVAKVKARKKSAVKKSRTIGKAPNVRKVHLHKDGLRTSGNIYWQRVYSDTAYKRNPTDKELEAIAKPHSYLRTRLATMLRQLRKGLDLKQIIFSKRSKHITEY